MSTVGKICSKGVWDESVPGIVFDDNGVSNYARLFESLEAAYPRGEVGKKVWEDKVDRMKRHGHGKRYDCVIGVSGGTDSCYLLHIAKTIYGLRPLAVNLDNGWNSDIAVKNIKKVTKKLGIDLVTYVIDYEEIKDLIRVFMLGSIPWIDTPTDLAIKAALYKIADKEKVKFILRGNDFRSEGTQPVEWTGGDAKVLRYLHKKYGKTRLKTFPDYSLNKLLYYGFFKNIESIYPYYHLEYQKKAAQKLLLSEYEWEYYGGHHHENVFTKFVMSYWLPVKFNIDKRKISLSAQVMSHAIEREAALSELVTEPYIAEEINNSIKYVIKKLDFSEEDFESIMKLPNKNFFNYPSYYPLFTRFRNLSNWVLRLVLNKKPMTMFQVEMRKLEK
jgi:N-acetyl sugar amidotransferase